jgi:ABC-type lipoprotein export system ATPase subunit
LKDIDIEIKDFLIFIGPQGTGKSLCAKLLYFFRTIFEENANYQMVSASVKRSDFQKMLRNKFISFFPKPYWAKQEFYIEYQFFGEKAFWIKKEKKQGLRVCLNQNVLAATRKMIISYMEFIKSDNSPETRKFLKLFSNENAVAFSEKNIFIPAERSFFSLVQKNIFGFLRTNNSIDPFLVEFGFFYEDIKQIKRDIPPEAQMLIASILKGEYMPEENLVRLADGNKVALELLSSGQQEALPLVIVFAYIISLRLDSPSFSTIYVEEPEAHLFPDAQEHITRLISFLRYNAKREVAFVITTHSPYILAAFNNLIKAGDIVRQNPSLKDAVCKEIPESMHIDIERFSDYALENGKAADIIDRETNLINADAIDGVSESIMGIFNALQDIEFDNSKAEDSKAGEYV